HRGADLVALLAQVVGQAPQRPQLVRQMGRCDKGALAGLLDDQSLVSQLPQRLAQRHQRGAVRRAQLALRGQRLTGGVLTVADLRGEVGGDGPVACHAAPPFRRSDRFARPAARLDCRHRRSSHGAYRTGLVTRDRPESAARSDATNAPTSAGPAPSRMRRMTAAPTMTPSATAAASAACCGVDIPKPRRTGRSVTCLTRAARSAADGASRSRSPVVPMTETAYTKPWLRRPISARRSSGVAGEASRLTAMPG